MKELTISIAAYNVEKYLDQTLKSLTDERYVDEIEVLVIDDGSKDNTKEVALRYQERHPQSIKYVAKENGGHGSTINKGIELATGKYFRIIDGDDYVDQDAFYEYINRLKNSSVDMIVTDLRAVDDVGNRRIDPGVIEHGKNPFDSLEENVIREINKKLSTRLFGLSTVTIKTDLLHSADIRITEKCFYVDVEFIVWCIRLANEFVFWKLPVYMYRKDPNGDNSVSKKNMIKNVAMQEKVALKLCSLYEAFLLENIDSNRTEVILQRVGISYGATIRTYMLLDRCSESKSHIARFDKEALRYKNAYKGLNQNIFIRMSRIMNYSLIPIIRMVYRRYISNQVSK